MTITRRTALGLFASALVPERLCVRGMGAGFLRTLLEGGKCSSISGRLLLKPRVINVARLGSASPVSMAARWTIIGSAKASG